MRNMKRWAVILTLIVVWLAVVPADCREQWRNLVIGLLQGIGIKLSCILTN